MDVDIWSRDEKRFSWRNGRGIGERREEGGNISEEMCEEMGEKICEKIGKKMGKKMGEKMGEKRGEDKRETAIYRVRSPTQNVKDNVKRPEARRRKRSHA